MIKVTDLKKDFPIFEREINGKRLTYLDSGATSQKPEMVINEMSNVYSNINANVHRGTYVLSSETTAKYEDVRNKLKDFINAYSSDEIIFTKGCTEGFNFLANSICKDLNPGDEIILSEIEHHANIIPWQMICKKFNYTLKYIPLLNNGTLDIENISQLITNRTKLISITHMSNVLGIINPVEKVTVSVFNFSLAKAHLPNLRACPLEVQPNADIFFTFGYDPSFAKSSLSCTYSIVCLQKLSGLLQVTFAIL